MQGQQAELYGSEKNATYSSGLLDTWVNHYSANIASTTTASLLMHIVYIL